MEFACYVVTAERLVLAGVEYRRGQLVFEDADGTDFRRAVACGEVIEIDPFGDLNVQFSVGQAKERTPEPVEA